MTAGRPTSLRAARAARGWSQSEAARALAELASTRGVAVASAASLKTQLSRWENGHATPETPYRNLLGELYAGAGVDLAPADPASVGP
ncbi:MAG TPA: helix-turn-helix transcriptional regulator, partial [Pseudonocardia sp.]|nr:helix-turn-helix transcriptional regulator [Pseudonocardia sp.]